MKIICHSLLVNDTLPYLILRNNKRLRSNGFNYIAVYIRKVKISINLFTRFLFSSKKSIVIYILYFLQSTTLTYLDLSGINIDKKSATFLAQALIQGTNKLGAVLETLKLDDCGLKNNVLEVLGLYFF